jgi:Zn-dependent protease with chaperone function
MTDMDEIQNVIAHETGHLVNRPLLGRGDSLTENTISSGMFMMGIAPLISLNLIGASYYLGAAIASKIGRHYFVRLDEYRADRTAALLADKPEKGPIALKKIFPKMLKAAYGDKWQEKLKKFEQRPFLYTHPSLEDREKYVHKAIQQMS